MQSEYCPLCSKNGAKVRVKAYQLNLEEAVFMCSTDECTWPVGYHELLFMDRHLGKYWTKDWFDIADKYLADHLKKQRDSLSELSAYTPPQTPGNSKDTIHDTTTTTTITADPSSLPMVRETDVPEQQPSTSKSQPYKIPVIDITGDNNISGQSISFEIPILDFTDYDTSTLDDKAISLEPVLGLQSEKSPGKALFITKDNSIDKIVVNPLSKHSALLVNKTVAIKDEKSSSVPEKSLTSVNVLCKKFRILGKQKSKSFNYKKQFDIFDDIKKEKSTNEQCKANKVVIKSKIDLDKMKPDEVKDILFVNGKTRKSVESCGIKLQPVRRLIKEESKACQSNVNISLELTKKEPSNDDNIHYDIDTIINASPAKLELDNKNWSAGDHYNLDSLLAMLEDDTPEDNLLATDNIIDDNASASIDTLPSESMKSEKNDNDLKMEVDSIIDDDTLQCTIEDTDDPFFASLFSPPMKQ